MSAPLINPEYAIESYSQGGAYRKGGEGAKAVEAYPDERNVS